MTETVDAHAVDLKIVCRDALTVSADLRLVLRLKDRIIRASRGRENSADRRSFRLDFALDRRRFPGVSRINSYGSRPACGSRLTSVVVIPLVTFAFSVWSCAAVSSLIDDHGRDLADLENHVKALE